MNYLGSKSKIARKLLEVILAGRKLGQWYVEPFVGGCNMIDKVVGNRLGNDNNPYLIAMWKALQAGWVPPPDLNERKYQEIRTYPDLFPPELVCFAAVPCSFGAKWFGGFACNSAKKCYADVASRQLVNQARKLKGVTFVCGDYQDLVIPEESIIYCDPPYDGLHEYVAVPKFNHVRFWSWVRSMSRKGHKVFVSELRAPYDFKCILEVEMTSPLNKNRKDIRVERLFRLP